MSFLQNKALRTIVTFAVLFGIAMGEFAQASFEQERLSNVITASQSVDPADSFSGTAPDELPSWEVLFLDNLDDDSNFFINYLHQIFVPLQFFEIVAIVLTQVVLVRLLLGSHQARSPPTFI